MKNKNRFILAMLLLFFAAALINLFLLRFQWGDVYPKYSSLRADPLGTKILYESLENLEGISVSRNYHAFSRMDESASTLFFMGIRDESLYAFTEDDANRLESVARVGGRLLLLFYPEKGCLCEKEDEEEAIAAEETVTDETIKEKSAGEGEEESEALPDFISINEHWQFDTHLGTSDDEGGHQVHNALLSARNEPLPETMEIHSDLYFTEMGDMWRTIYARDGLPVIIERELGKGSVVLVADTYFASNEGLTHKRNDELLSWLIGANSRVVMDETHLGVMNNPGVASLGRRYNLEGLVAAVLLVVLLYIWKNAVPFLPPQREEYAAAGSNDITDVARDHLSGFTGLLKRTVPADALLSTCLKEWEKSAEKKFLSSLGGTAEFHELLNAEKSGSQGRSSAVALYRRISKIMSERKYRI